MQIYCLAYVAGILTIINPCILPLVPITIGWVFWATKHQQPGWRADSGPCTVIGAGGGGRAVVYGLLEEGAKEVRLVNRTQHKAERIAEDFNGPISVYPWKERNSLLEGAMTVVNVTNQGMVGEAPLDITLEKLAPDALAADIIYTPLESPFLAAAGKRQNRTVNGLGMLLHQGLSLIHI